MDDVFLLVGLGNSGPEYTRTRHNAGFMLVENLAAKWKWSWTNERRFGARIAKGSREGRRILLCQPRTFMNLSGRAVASLMDFYQAPLSQILVVADDADLPLGNVRLRPGGSSGGHHGLESIEEHLASRQFARLKIGIGRNAGSRQITGHVLGRFDGGENELLAKVLERAVQQVEIWLRAGIEQAMQLNGRLDQMEPAA